MNRLFLVTILCALICSCHSNNSTTSLVIENKSSFEIGWELSGLGRKRFLHFEGEIASSKEELLELLKKYSGFNAPYYTFGIIEAKPCYYEDGTPMPEEWGPYYEGHLVGSVLCENCNFVYCGKGGEGLLGDYIETYDFRLVIDDSFLSEVAAANGVDFSSFEGMKKK